MGCTLADHVLVETKGNNLYFGKVTLYQSFFSIVLLFTLWFDGLFDFDDCMNVLFGYPSF